MKIFKRLHWLSLIIGALSVILPIVFWGKFPDEIPMHYNEAGIVDNWEDKSTLIVFFFVIALMMGLMSIVVYFVKANMISKYSKAYEKSEMSMVYPMLILTNLAIQCMFAYMMFCSVTCRNLGRLFMPIALIGVFAPIVWMIVGSIKGRKNSGRPKHVYESIEQQEQGILYRSAVDLWLVLVIVGCEALVIWTAIDAAIEKGTVDWMTFFVAIGCSAIFIPLFGIKYVMYEEHLLVSMSIFGKTRIAYKDIVEVKKSSNPLSSPALSLKRVQVDYIENGVHRMALISPKNREVFIKEIEDRRERSKS